MPQAMTQHSSVAAVNIEKINLVSTQKGTVSVSQHLPVDGASSAESKRTNVGEQLMDRLEQISRSQGNWQTAGGDGFDTER